jgi:galactokinase
MIPENKLVERNTNVINVLKPLVISKNYKAIYNFGELLMEQHVSLKKTFCVVTSRVDNLEIQTLREKLEEKILKELDEQA